jgi:hypothetical protein
MRGLLAILLVVGCGSSNPGTTGDGGGDDDVDGGGDVDAPPDPCAPGTWCTETAPVTTLLRAVWAANTNAVYAVGDGGVILRRRDNTWTQMDSGTTNTLRGLWGTSASNVWVVGEGGTVLRFDGSTWTPQTPLGFDGYAVWGASATDIWISGNGQVTHYNGSTFEPMALQGELFALSGSATNNVWVTGENAKIDHFTGTWATGIDAGAGNTYFAILAFSPTDVWVSSFVPNSETLQFDGGNWTPHDASSVTFSSFYGISPTDIWGAGNNAVGHWNGSAWTLEAPAGNAVQLVGAGGVGQSLWIVGTDSTILHRR